MNPSVLGVSSPVYLILARAYACVDWVWGLGFRWHGLGYVSRGGGMMMLMRMMISHLLMSLKPVARGDGTG